MSRYIDADAMLEYLELAYDNHSNMDTLYNTGVLVAINYIKHKADTIDIVRCKECEWLKVHNTKELYAECRKWHIRFYPFDEDTRTHGCSWGEREGE